MPLRTRERLSQLDRLLAEASPTLPRQFLVEIDGDIQEIAARVRKELRAARGAVRPENANGDDAYFPGEPSLDAAPTEEELAEADDVWRGVLSRQRQIRAEAVEQLGGLLTPAEVSRRLGLSGATVNNRRNHGELLGIRLDKRGYLFPEWQFSDSPRDAALGVWPGFDRALQALSDMHPWEKGEFFLSQLPALGGRRPIDLLRDGRPADVERVVLAAAAHHDGGY